MELPDHVRRAVWCGPIPEVRDVEIVNAFSPETLTTGEKVILFAHTHLVVPEGPLVGKPLKLDIFQQVFILAVFDNPHGTNVAFLSMGRRNSKTFVIAVIILAFLIGPLAGKNETYASAAQSRDQAGLVFKLMEKMVALSPDITPYLQVTPSGKRIQSVMTGSEFYAMSADAKTGLGRPLKLVIYDEAGQVRGAASDYISMLETSQGNYDDALFIGISTQSPSDLDWLSIQIDDAVRNQPKDTVAHVYEPGNALGMEGKKPSEVDFTDESLWIYSNPGLGKFRSRKDLKKQTERAQRIPANEAGVRNLNFNQRVAQVGLWLAPRAWRDCGAPIDIGVFRRNRVVLGMDLSERTDLTATVAAAEEEGIVHLLPFVFCPEDGIEERSRRDRTTYDDWVRDGFLIALAGPVVDYKQIIQYLDQELPEMDIHPEQIIFDRYRIENFKARAEEENWATDVEWVEQGQGYAKMPPLLEDFEGLLLTQRIRHGNHPLLTMAAANAIAVKNPTGEKKLDKSKSTTRIDPLVAAVMAAHYVSEGARDSTSLYEEEGALL